MKGTDRANMEMAKTIIKMFKQAGFLGSVRSMIARQRGQVRVYLLNPGRHLTRKLRKKDQKRQQMMAKAQPQKVTSLETSVVTS